MDWKLVSVTESNLVSRLPVVTSRAVDNGYLHLQERRTPILRDI